METASEYKTSRLKGDYVDRLAETAARSLLEGLPVVIAYEPGNATRYEVILTPLGAAVEPVTSYPVAQDCGRDHCVAVAVMNMNAAMVLPMLEHGFYYHPSYIREKLDLSDGDALALMALFEAINEAVHG